MPSLGGVAREHGRRDPLLVLSSPWQNPVAILGHPETVGATLLDQEDARRAWAWLDPIFGSFEAEIVAVLA
ncbi:hypothetical protein NDU88_001378 [Pleurodeles waltl]|uniref:Uncharacterized protein n=1 Tax=Pleurodeles waltl TaxID=8319 RepID=A0AAV7LCY9_PLEWA|nr:hypothetical protein NDU88_001378 [Pleurodeles waltl]